MGALLAALLFIGGALFFFLPLIFENLAWPRIDYIALVSTLLGSGLIAVVTGLTLGQWFGVWFGVMLVQVRGR